MPQWVTNGSVPVGKIWLLFSQMYEEFLEKLSLELNFEST